MPSVRKSATRRDSYHHGDLKRALTDAALSLVAEKGPKGFTLTEAARRAGEEAFEAFFAGVNAEVAALGGRRLALSLAFPDRGDCERQLTRAVFSRLPARFLEYVREREPPREEPPPREGLKVRLIERIRAAHARAEPPDALEGLLRARKQRFFAQLLLSMKLPSLLPAIDADARAVRTE